MISPVELLAATLGASTLFLAGFALWVRRAILSPLPVATPPRRRRRSRLRRPIAFRAG